MVRSGSRSFASRHLVAVTVLFAGCANDDDDREPADAAAHDVADTTPSLDAASSDADFSTDAGGIADAGTVADAGTLVDAATDAATDAGMDADADAGTVVDAGTDAGTDAGAVAGTDAATDAPTDAGSTPDAGAPDAALALPDAGTPDPDAGPPVLVVVTDGVIDEGRTCLRIDTPVATYFYDVEGAGFTSILDRDGNDWVGWSTATAAAGEYRGIPNMGRCCHPGYTGATTRVVSEAPDRVRIESTGRADSNAWRVTWDFTPDHATLTVHDAPGPYYLLYEGTPGGRLGSEDYFVTSEGPATRTSLDAPGELITEDLPDPEWIYFADAPLRRALLVFHHEDDTIGDRYWTMGGLMTVFGFGRTAMGGATGLTTTPQHMSIALIEDVTFDRAAEAVGAMER